MSGWSFHPSHLASADGLQCVRCLLLRREFAATHPCRESETIGVSETPAPASRFSDAELAAIDKALMTLPLLLRARVLARVAGTDQIAAQQEQVARVAAGATIPPTGSTAKTAFGDE